MKNLLLSLIFTGASLNIVSAVEFDNEDSTDFTYEQRLKMAGIHEQAAVCLKSTRAAVDCHEEMMSACQKIENKRGCSLMMGMQMNRHGHRQEMGNGNGNGKGNGNQK